MPGPRFSTVKGGREKRDRPSYAITCVRGALLRIRTAGSHIQTGEEGKCSSEWLPKRSRKQKRQCQKTKPKKEKCPPTLHGRCPHVSNATRLPRRGVSKVVVPEWGQQGRAWWLRGGGGDASREGSNRAEWTYLGRCFVKKSGESGEGGPALPMVHEPTEEEGTRDTRRWNGRSSLARRRPAGCST